MFKIKIKKVKIPNNNKNNRKNKNKKPKNLFTWLFNAFIFIILITFTFSLVSNLFKNEKERKELKVSLNEIVKNINESQNLNIENSTSSTSSIKNILIEGNKVMLEVGTGTLFVADKENGETFLNVLKSYDVSSTTLNNLNIQVKEENNFNFWTNILPILLPIIFLIVII